MFGINPLEDFPGFRRVSLMPQPNPLLNYAKATLNTAAGLYESGWSFEEKGLRYKFLIPFNAQAELVLQGVDINKVVINGIAIENSGLHFYEKDDNLMIVLKTGNYEIWNPLVE